MYAKRRAKMLLEANEHFASWASDFIKAAQTKDEVERRYFWAAETINLQCEQIFIELDKAKNEKLKTINN
jgi:hypothetical protein